MNAKHKIELDNAIVAMGFKSLDLLSHYTKKCKQGKINVVIDTSIKAITYTSTFTLPLFKKNGTRFWNNDEKLLDIFKKIAKASKWTSNLHIPDDNIQSALNI